ncbi:MAG: hypothetical protein ACU83O_14370, partial [Gammaproteobacteria bacterium]
NAAQQLFKFEAKQLEQWISELPVVNTSLASRRICDFIIEFNSYEMPGNSRLEALELLRPCLSTLEEDVRSRIIKYGFPKDENDHAIVNVIISIQKEFAIGYWIAARELTRKPIGWLKGKNVALALQRCIKGLGNVVISHMIMGMPVPDWVWMDLHSLYKLSVKLNKQSAKVSIDDGSPLKKSSPEDSYKQILLLSLADPAGLMPNEIIPVYQFIEMLTPLVCLQNRPAAGQRRQCLILIDEDKPPFFQSDTTRHHDTAALYLNLLKVYKTLNKQLKELSPQGRFSSTRLWQCPATLSSEMTDYLKQRWKGQELHGSALFSDRLDRCFTIGLASIHALANPGDAGAGNRLEQRAESESDTLLSCQIEPTGLLTVGSLISFRNADSTESPWAVGIVNKLFASRQNSKIHFGIQLYSPQFLAVTYSLPYAARKDEPQKALFYNRTDSEKEISFMIVDNSHLKEGDIININRQNDHFPFELNNRKNIGLGYWLFGCEESGGIENRMKLKKAMI